jgi:hypothetical protein
MSAESYTDPSPTKAPPSVYLSWPKPNYVDPVTEGPALVLVGIILSSIAILLVAARIYSRIFITRALGIDDLLILISLVSKYLPATETLAKVITGLFYSLDSSRHYRQQKVVRPNI